MTNLSDILLSEIKLGERHRIDYGEPGEWAAFVEDIKKNGVLQPITIREDMVLMAGGRRYKAAQEAGLTDIPCLIRALPESDKDLDLLEIELAENVHRKDFSWQERARLESCIYDLRKTRGLSQRDTAEFLGTSKGALDRHIQLQKAVEVFPELAGYKTESDAWKAKKRLEEGIIANVLASRAEKKVVYTGAAWQNSKHHYQIGDCVEGLKTLNDNTFHFAEVDPPYGINLPQLKRFAPSAVTYKEVSDEDHSALIEAVAKETFRILAPNTFCAWWFAMSHYTLIRGLLEEVGFDVIETPAIWHKPSFTGQTQDPSGRLSSAYDSFFVCKKGRPALVKQGHPNVFSFKVLEASQKYHPAERPLELMTEILGTFCWPHTNILVPFLGSGATLRAAYKANLSGMGWDMNTEYRSKFLVKVLEDHGVIK